jgi:hypothetical protein
MVLVSEGLCCCFYFFRICLFAGYEHYLLSISKAPAGYLVLVGCIFVVATCFAKGALMDVKQGGRG